MKNWINENLRKIIIGAFVVPILLVAFVSISHVTSFYGLSNPFTWSIYLSVGIEIAALSALAAVSVNMGRFVYLPFFIVTLIQMLGNIFFSFTFIDETSQSFQDWISMIGGLFENMGVEKTDLNTHKTILSFLTGGLLPIISLTFAHMLVKFSENEKNTDNSEKIENPVVVDLPELMSQKRKEDEKVKYTPTQEQLDLLEKVLTQKYKGPQQEKIIEEPIKPTQEELDELETLMGEIVKDKFFENKTEYEPYGEDGTEFYNAPIENSENDKLPEPEPFVEIIEPISEPQNIIQEEPQVIEDKKKSNPETEEISDYKVLTYYNRND
jgi:hypothetical protein